jgi:protein-tyrosine phosphatase
MKPQRSVLFVCLGNICRSRTAEGVMRRRITERGLEDRVAVGSAGTGDYHVGEPADPRMRRAAARRGYELDGTARQVDRGDFERFDLIVAMDRENLRDLRYLKRRAGSGETARVHLLSDFLPAGSPVDVPDPYYQGGFDRVIDLIEEACPAILDRLAGAG